MLMRLMSKGEYLIVPKGTKFTGSGKLGLSIIGISTSVSAPSFILVVITSTIATKK